MSKKLIGVLISLAVALLSVLTYAIDTYGPQVVDHLFGYAVNDIGTLDQRGSDEHTASEPVISFIEPIHGPPSTLVSILGHYCPVDEERCWCNAVRFYEIQAMLVIFDFSLGCRLGYDSPTYLGKGIAYALRTDDLRAVDGFLPKACVPQVRRSIWWQPARAVVHVPGSVSVHGIRAAHLPREPAGHRDVSARDAQQAVPCGTAWQGITQHAG